ncbi:hypothetical protein XFFB_02045 [Xylella fastidiosa]|nr:hypothetical protein XFFB_02045 [Xylella fastidiosa]
MIGGGAAASERKGMLCRTEGAVECVWAGVGMDGVVAQGLANGAQALRFWEWDEGVVHDEFLLVHLVMPDVVPALLTRRRL